MTPFLGVTLARGRSSAGQRTYRGLRHDDRDLSICPTNPTLAQCPGCPPPRGPGHTVSSL